MLLVQPYLHILLKILILTIIRYEAITTLLVIENALVQLVLDEAHVVGAHDVKVMAINPLSILQFPRPELSHCHEGVLRSFWIYFRLFACRIISFRLVLSPNLYTIMEFYSLLLEWPDVYVPGFV